MARATRAVSSGTGSMGEGSSDRSASSFVQMDTFTPPSYPQDHLLDYPLTFANRILKAGRFLEACQLFLVPAREARLLLDVAKTLGQTRSGTGHTHALGQVLPRIRALDDNLYCCPQARLRTLPEILGKRGKEGLEIEMRRQKRGVQVTLHRPNTTGALVPAE